MIFQVELYTAGNPLLCISYICNESEEIFIWELKKNNYKTLIVLNIFELFNLERYQNAQSSNLQFNSVIESIEKKKKKKKKTNFIPFSWNE